MQQLTLSDADLDAVEQPDTDGARWLSTFPFTPDRSGETLANADDYTVVYNELEPGTQIGTHQDGVDEIVYVIDGTLKATVDGNTRSVEAGELAVFPAEISHSVENTGTDRAKLLGFFPDGDLDSTFEHKIVPVSEKEE